MAIKLSICIPTKNRYQTLKIILEATILNIKDQNIEIIIQDNSEDNLDFLQYIEQIHDHRLVYRHSSAQLTMAQNVELATVDLKGEFLVIIGDDDFVHPNIIEILSAIDTEGKDCFVYDRGIYYWPDVVFQKESKFFRPSSLQTMRHPSFKLHEYDSMTALRAVAQAGCLNLGNLPCAYHGVLRVSIAEDIRERFGKFILGPSPDMAMAIAIALTIKSYHWIDVPLTTPGASYVSAAGMGRRGAHSASLDALPPSMPASLKDDWVVGVPRIWNGFTLYAHTAVRVSQMFDYELAINKLKFCTKLISDNIQDERIVRESMYFKSLSAMDKFLCVAVGNMVSLLKYLFWFLPNSFANYLLGKKQAFREMEVINNVYEPSTAMKILSTRYKKSSKINTQG